jgi:hypothetical protein
VNFPPEQPLSQIASGPIIDRSAETIRPVSNGLPKSLPPTG